MAWSSTARLNALNVHDPFALTLDQPKQRNPFIPPPSDYYQQQHANGHYQQQGYAPPQQHYSSTPLAMDQSYHYQTNQFLKTIPLSELIRAEKMQQERMMMAAMQQQQQMQATMNANGQTQQATPQRRIHTSNGATNRSTASTNLNGTFQGFSGTGTTAGSNFGLTSRSTMTTLSTSPSSPFSLTSASASSSLPSTAATLPLRVPPGYSYSESLNAVHEARADRLIRQPKGWSQPSYEQLQQQQRGDSSPNSVEVYDTQILDEIREDAEREKQAEREKEKLAQEKRRMARQQQREAAAAAGSEEEKKENNSLMMSSTQQMLMKRNRHKKQKKLNSTTTAVNKDDQEESKQQDASVVDPSSPTTTSTSTTTHQSHIHQRMLLNTQREEEKFSGMLHKLAENRELLNEISSYLNTHDTENRRRKEELYKSWCEMIYGPIQSAIHAELRNHTTSEIEERRRKAFDTFLRISNRRSAGLYSKHGEGEYHPSEERKKNTIRIVTQHLSDPLKSSLQQTEEEWRLYSTFYPQAERIQPQTKASLLNPQIWAKYKIESTPHGRYSLLHGNILQPVGKKLVAPSQSYSSEFTTEKTLDHYTIDRTQTTVKQQFFPKGKKVNGDGYKAVAEKVDYNVISNVEPSMSKLYGYADAQMQPPRSAPSSQQQLPEIRVRTAESR